MIRLSFTLALAWFNFEWLDYAAKVLSLLLIILEVVRRWRKL